MFVIRCRHPGCNRVWLYPPSAADSVRTAKIGALATHVGRCHGKAKEKAQKRPSSESSSSASMEPPAPKRRRTKVKISGEATISATTTHATGVIMVPPSVMTSAAANTAVAAPPPTFAALSAVAAATAAAIAEAPACGEPPKTLYPPLDTSLLNSLPNLPSVSSDYNSLPSSYGLSQSTFNASIHYDLTGDGDVAYDNDLLSFSQKQQPKYTFDDHSAIHNGKEGAMVSLTQPGAPSSSSSSSSVPLE